MLTNLLLAASLAGGPEIQWTAPSMFIAGRPYVVDISITAPAEGALITNWLLTPSAFTVDGNPLASRDDERTFRLPGGFSVSGTVDLGRYITASGEFALGYADGILQQEPIKVRVIEPPSDAAPEGLDFMEMPVEQLSAYNVLLLTNRGEILLEVWPDIAPGHVRNFLDLSYTGFYDETIFHRVIPTFMVQGGDPTGTGAGNGPRSLKAEFDPEVKHVAGTLSMARGGDVNSASCQFFIVHGPAPHLDGQYTAFGKLTHGQDVVDAIARTPRNRQDRPNKPQTIISATVVAARGGE